MTEGSVTDIILSRAQTADRLNGMIVWSVAAHIALFIFMIFMPASWRGAVDEGPRTVMTISLGGAPGPRNGGLTTMGGRTVQAPPPEPVKKVVETPPAPKTPEMALPTKNARVVKPQTREAPKEATARTPATGEPQEGSTRVNTGARGQGSATGACSADCQRQHRRCVRGGSGRCSSRTGGHQCGRGA